MAAAKVIAAVLGECLHINGGEEVDGQIAKLTQLAMDTVPVAIQSMVENLPVELQGQVLAAYKDKYGNIQWGYFPAAEVKRGYINP
jgi:hypothetical protein